MSNINVMRKNLGPVTAYKYAVTKGYQGTEEEFAELMASYASIAQDVSAESRVAEGYALGKQNGVDVGDQSPYYHANAKYHAEQAAASASAAAESARTLTIDPTLTHSGQAADAKKTGDEITGLKEDLTTELLNGNAFDILTFCNHPSQTHRGVTFNWSGLSCSVTGTATNGAASDTFFDSANGFPFGMHAGGTYRLKHTATNVNVQVFAYINGVRDTSNILATVMVDKVFTVPSDATGIHIRLAVSSGVTVNETVSPKLYTDVSTNRELMEQIGVTSVEVAKSADGVVLNELYQVDDWATYTYIDTNNGLLKPTEQFVSASKNLIPVPSGTQIHVHGAQKVFLYNNDGSFKEAIAPAGIDRIVTSDDAAYIRIQYGSIDQAILDFYVAYRYSAIKEEQSIDYRINIATNGVQYPGVTIALKTGNPIVLTDCDSKEPFDVFSLNGTPINENVVICGKNIFALRHVNGTFSKNSVTFTFNTILNTIRIRSTGATASSLSGFTDFGDDFKTVNGSVLYHNFKFRFPVKTRVSISDNANQEVPFDFGVQMRVYDGTNTINCGTGGVSFDAEAETEYVVYFLVKEGWSGDITYSPQVEISEYPTAYERFYGIKTALTASGDKNIFQCGGTAPGRLTLRNGGIKAIFDSGTNEVYLDAQNPTSTSFLIYDATKDGTVNGQAFNYIFKFMPGAVPVYVRGFPKKYAKLIYAQVSDGTTVSDDFTGDGIFFQGVAGKEYAFRLGVRYNTSHDVAVNAIVKPVIATGLYALKEHGTRAGTTVLYTDGNTELTVHQRQMSTKVKAEQTFSLTKAINVLTGGHIYTPFGKLNARGPMVSFIDDDTWSLYCVQRYHDIFAAKGVLGGYAVITENMVTNPSTMQAADPNLLPTLLEYEKEGFAMLYHCHDQNGANTRYWINGDPSYDQSLINDNFMSGLRAISTMGFSNYKYWVTPYGVNDKYIQDLAKNHGMQCLFNCPNVYAQEGFVSAHGNVSRWNIPRVIFGNWTTNDALLHRAIQGAKAANGWVIIVSHVNSWGAAGSESNIALGNRLSALIQYCLDEGLEIVPAPVAFEEYRASFLLNELF